MAKQKALSLDDINEGGSSITEAEAGALIEPEVEPQPEPTPEPEPQVEPKAEEIKAEPLKEEPEVQNTPLKEEPPVEKEFDLEFFNKTYSKEYTSVDQIQAALDKPTMESEYEELKTKYDDLSQTNDILAEQLDPATHFSSEEAMKVEQFKKNNPKKDPAIAQKLFSTADLSEIDDLEVVKMARKFRSKKLPGTDADLEAAILEELNIDPETPRNEWPNTAQIRLASMADGERDTFDKLKEGVVLPETVNIGELKAQRKQASDEQDALIASTWGTAAEEALKSTEKLKLPIGKPAEGEEQRFFEWDLGSPPQEAVDALKQEFINSKISPGEGSQDIFNESLRAALLSENLPQILQKLTDDIEARKEEEFLDRTHNPNPLTDTQRTEGSEAEKETKERTAFATEGIGAGFHGHPLFNIKQNT